MAVQMRPLDFTQDILDKRIAWIQLKNIQGIKDMQFNVPTSGIVRFDAPSEVGKSAIFKPFEALATDKYNSKRDIDSLVTKGETYGEILVRLVNGMYIGLHLDCKKTTNSFYLVQHPDGKREYLHYPNDMPTILDYLGWYSTGIKKNDFSMNVRLKGELPIIETSKRLNTELFNIALNDELLENTYTILKQALSDSIDFSMNCQRQVEQINHTLNQLQVEDESALERDLHLLTKLQEEDTQVEVLADTITNVYTISERKPQSYTAPKDVKQAIETLQVLNKLETNLNKIVSTVAPETYRLDKGLPNHLEDLTKVSTALTQISKIMHANRPSLHEVDKQIPKQVEELARVGTLLDCLTTLQDSVPPTKVSIDKSLASNLLLLTKLTQLETYITQLQTLETRKPTSSPTQLHLDKIVNRVEYLMYLQSTLEQIDTDLKEIRKEKAQYQCPTCKQFYTECED